MKKPAKGHHGHTYCGGLCVPHWLHEQFEEQLGPKAQEMDLLAWYPRRDAQRRLEQIVVSEPLTWWRDAFQAEIAFRGWFTPKYRPAKPLPPVQAAKLAGFSDVFGQTKEQKDEKLKQFFDWKTRQAGNQ